MQQTRETERDTYRHAQRSKQYLQKSINTQINQAEKEETDT